MAGGRRGRTRSRFHGRFAKVRSTPGCTAAPHRGPGDAVGQQTSTRNSRGEPAMKLGLNLGYWGLGNDADNLAVAQEADRLGYSVVWAAEAYGSDTATVLTWIAAQTRNVDV